MERSKTSQELTKAFEKALDLADDRNLLYGERWLEEPIEALYENVFRKADGVKYMVRNGNGHNGKLLEHLLDVIDYTAMVFLRLEKEKR